jgi:hypothetical protein
MRKLRAKYAQTLLATWKCRCTPWRPISHSSPCHDSYYRGLGMYPSQSVAAVAVQLPVLPTHTTRPSGESTAHANVYSPHNPSIPCLRICAETLIRRILCPAALSSWLPRRNIAPYHIRRQPGYLQTIATTRTPSLNSIDAFQELFYRSW